MALAAIDASVLVAGVLDWHADHAICRTERARWEQLTEKPCIPAHALLESYSVITRLPAGLRLRAEDALEVLYGAYGALPVAPVPKDLWGLIDDLARRDVIGGAVYDAVILESAVLARTEELVTLDSKVFERLARDRIRVRRPGDQ